MTPVIHPTITTPHFKNMLIEKLPKVRGRLTPNAPLGHLTWFGVGGPAEVLFKPHDRDDLVEFIKNCPLHVPITVMGVASNLIVRDGGIPGVVIRMGREFATIENRDGNIYAGSAAIDMNVALFSATQSIAGLEFLSGIPGTIGGALRMNAGAYGTETKDVLISADVMLRDGTVKTLTTAEMDMSYRHNGIGTDTIFLGGLFKGTAGDKDAIEQKMADIKNKRSESQPIRTKTGGSTFANPDNEKAWQLIDNAGCRGLKIGNAQVSEMHCNFLLNTGDATAADVERLGEEVRKRVYAQSGIMLRWEIKRVGIPLDKDTDIQQFMENNHG